MILRANATNPIIDKIRLGDSFANLNLQCEMYFLQWHLVVNNETIILLRMTLIMTNKFDKYHYKYTCSAPPVDNIVKHNQ